jgi:hypothetical protein
MRDACSVVWSVLVLWCRSRASLEAEIHLVRKWRHPAGRVLQIEKPQAFSRCGSPGSKMYCYEIVPQPR